MRSIPWERLDSFLNFPNPKLPNTLISQSKYGSCYVMNSYVIRIKDLVIQPFVYRLIKTDNTKSPPNLFILILDLCHVIFNFVSRDVQ